MAQISSQMISKNKAHITKKGICSCCFSKHEQNKGKDIVSAA